MQIQEEKLIRSMGRWDLTALVLNGIIGAGIFGLPSKAAALIGSHSIYAVGLCAVIIALIVFCYVEVSSRFSSTGGPYLYAREAFGSIVGFEVGWLYWIVRVTTFAANCNLFVTYLGFFIPSTAEPIVRILIIFLVVGTLAAVNLMGVKQSSLMTNIFTVGKIAPLLLFVLVGAFYINGANFDFSTNPSYTSFSAAVLLLVYAFVGFEGAVIMAGEVKNPERSVPFGLLTALGITTVLYAGIQIVSMGTLPELATSERPLADASLRFMGAAGASIIAVGALLSIIGNLNVGLLSSTRLMYSMGERRELPAVLSKVSERTRAPYISILFTAFVILVLTIQSSFLTAVAIATITRLLVFATTCLALPVFRRRNDVPPAQFQVPLGIVAAILSVLLIVWLLSNVDFKKEGLTILAAGLAGLILYAISKLINKRMSPEDTTTKEVLPDV